MSYKQIFNENDSEVKIEAASRSVRCGNSSNSGKIFNFNQSSWQNYAGFGLK